MSAVATASTDGEPIELGTGATTLHVTAGANPEELSLALVNITAGAVDATVTIAGGTPLVVTVPAESPITIGPFSMLGTLSALAGAATSVYALVTARR